MGMERASGVDGDIRYLNLYNLAIYECEYFQDHLTALVSGFNHQKS